MVGGAGSRYGNTYYDTINDFVECGRWDDDNGKTRIESKNNNVSSANVIKDVDAAMKKIEKLV